MTTAKKDILIIIILFFITFFIRTAGGSNISMYGDEWEYWDKIHKILANNFAPRADVFEHAPPLLSYIGAIVTLFFGGDLNVLRMISVIIGSLTVPFLYLFGSAIYDRKTGLLAAFLLSISAYNALYSRIFMLEALTLFFVTAFFYFFWKSQHSEQRKSIIYAIFAGAMMGLAFDAKYISFFLIPSILAYILWVKNLNFKALTDKRIIVIAIFAFLFFFPLLISLYVTGVGLDPFYFMTVEKFSKNVVGHTRVVDLPLPKLIQEGSGKMLEVFSTWGTENFSSTWKYLFKFSATLLFILVIYYYLINFIRREEKSSCLIITLFTIFMVALVIGNQRHYLLYAQPFYYLMFSHFSINILNKLLKTKKNYKNALNGFIILLIGITLFSSFITGITSPSWEIGDSFSWVNSAVDYVIKDISKNNYERPVFIGLISYRTEFLEYPFFLNNIDVYIIPILKSASDYSSDIAYVDIDRLDIFKPSYLVLSESYYNQYFKANVKSKIFEDYRIVLHTQTYPNRGFVLKRKNIQQSNLFTQTNSTESQIISRDMFNKSVPSIMRVGEAYTVLVQVRNTIDSNTNFNVRVYSNEFILYVEDEWQTLNFDKGSIHTFKIKIIPFKEYNGKLPITADIYIKKENDKNYNKKADSVTGYVSLIKR